VRFSQWWLWRVSSSGIWRRVVRWVAPDVSEERIASIFRVEELVQQTSEQAGGKQKRRVQLNGLHGVISQKMILFIVKTGLLNITLLVPLWHCVVWEMFTDVVGLCDASVFWVEEWINRHHEDGEGTFLWNTGKHLPVYMPSHPTKTENFVLTAMRIWNWFKSWMGERHGQHDALMFQPSPPHPFLICVAAVMTFFRSFIYFSLDLCNVWVIIWLKCPRIKFAKQFPPIKCNWKLSFSDKDPDW
jgi:hypothetical protein